MKKAASVLLTFIFISILSNAQDRMYYKNGNSEDVKVLEIGKDDISFKKYANLEGPIYHELKSAIDKIVYVNGTTENFTTAKESVSVSKMQSVSTDVSKNKELEETKFAFKKNAITFSVTDVLFKRISIAYEHIFANGYIGLKVPFTFGIGSNKIFDVDFLNATLEDAQNNQYNYYSSYYLPQDEAKYTSIIRKNTVGLELNAYPFGQRPVSFFVGPAFYLGQADYKYELTQYELANNNGYDYYNIIVTQKQEKATFYSGMINTGFAFKSTPHFSTVLHIGLGFRKNNIDFDEKSVTIISPGFQMGYIF